MIYKNSQSGSSMVEVMGYMAAVIAIVAGISKLITGAYSEYRISKASVQIADLAGAITKSSAIDTDYVQIINQINGNTDDAKLNEEGLKLVPSSYKVKKGSDGKLSFYNAFGGPVSIGLFKKKFRIIFNELTREQCIELAMKEWENNKIVDLDSVVINGKSWCWPIYQGCGNTLPVTRSSVTGKSAEDLGGCNSEKDNTIMWVFN